MLRVELRKSHNKFMKLRAYLDDLPRGGITKFAGKVGVSPVYLSQLAAEQNGRVPSAELCVVIERVSEKTITRQELRPTDWQGIWPELAQSPATTAQAATETVAGA